MRILLFLMLVPLLCVKSLADVRKSASVPVKEYLFIEEMALKADTLYYAGRNKATYEDELCNEIRARLDLVNNEGHLFSLAVLLQESHPELFESPDDRIFFFAIEIVVHRLAKLQTKTAYYYFCKLRDMYYIGSDKYLECKYFKKYSKDDSIKHAITPLQFL